MLLFLIIEQDQLWQYERNTRATEAIRWPNGEEKKEKKSSEIRRWVLIGQSEKSYAILYSHIILTLGLISGQHNNLSQ